MPLPYLVRPVLVTACLLSIPAQAQAYGEPFQWSSGWGMGTTEYTTNDGNDNELYIACPDYDGYVSAHATINGQRFSSEGEGFDVIVDGERYDNPFNTACRVCSDIFRSFWDEMRNANNLKIAANGMEARLPTQGASEVLPAQGAPENSCRSEW